MIKYVFIDLDNTIFDFNSEERLALSKTLSELGVVPCDEILDRYHEVNLAQWKRLELGEITKAQVKENRYRILFDEFSVDASPVEATKIYEHFLSQNYSFIDGAYKLLEELSKSYKLYLASNGTLSVQNGRLDRAGIKAFFDGIFISEEVGAEKPNSEFFERAFASINGFKKSQAVIIGDSLSSDIKGGNNAGITTIWYNAEKAPDNSEIVPSFEVCSLSEIPMLLANH